MIRVDKNGEKYWEIETEKDIFKGIKSFGKLRQTAYNYLLNNRDIGSVLIDIVDGKQINFLRISAEEFAYGSNTDEMIADDKKIKLG